MIRTTRQARMIRQGILDARRAIRSIKVKSSGALVVHTSWNLRGTAAREVLDRQRKRLKAYGVDTDFREGVVILSWQFDVAHNYWHGSASDWWGGVR